MARNHLIKGKQVGVGKKVNFKRKIYLYYLAKKIIKWRKIHCFGEKGGEKIIDPGETLYIMNIGHDL